MFNNIGKYKVNGLIARGATSKVYLAEDPHLSIQVAIKVFDCQVVDANKHEHASTHDAQNSNVLADFTNESKILHQLSSAPHIVSFMDFDFTTTKQAYIVMPYFRRCLADLLGGESKLSTFKTIQIAKQILTGLCHIHDAGLVHLDIKPANILLDDKDQVQITDFGISIDSKILSSQHKPNTAQTGVGSINFASPEQISGNENITNRSDLFSVAALMYRCLSGRHFSIENTPLHDLNPNINIELSKIIQQALSFSADKRPSSAKAFYTMLSDVESRLEGHGDAPQNSVDPDATRVWDNSRNSTNSVSTLGENIQNTLLNEGEINTFHFKRLALLAKAELHEGYSDEWLRQYIEQSQSQLARQDNKVAAFFLWMEQVNTALDAAEQENKNSLSTNQQDSLIALAKPP